MFCDWELCDVGNVAGIPQQQPFHLHCRNRIRNAYRHILHLSVCGCGYTGARNDTTQQSGQTLDKEVEIKNVTVHVSGYTETDTTGMLSPPVLV